MELLWQELKMNFKMLLVWAVCVGGLCFGCLVMYGSLEDSVSEMSDMFANMGNFSEALGMDKVGIGTLEGYYAVEISLMLSLGGAIFAAMLGAGLIAKEEEGHTNEYLNVLPMGRGRILWEKYGAMVMLLVIFHVICISLILLGFAWMGSMPEIGNFVKYHIAAFLMCLEIGTVCFLWSTICRKKPTGAAIGIAVLLYMANILCRIVPALEKVKYITPFYYSNAADIFAGEGLYTGMYGIGAGVTFLALGIAFMVYQKKDFA